MFKKVVTLSTLLLTLLCMTILGVAANPQKSKVRSKRAASDNLIYAHVFQLADTFAKESEKTAD